MFIFILNNLKVRKRETIQQKKRNSESNPWYIQNVITKI